MVASGKSYKEPKYWNRQTRFTSAGRGSGLCENRDVKGVTFLTTSVLGPRGRSGRLARERLYGELHHFRICQWRRRHKYETILSGCGISLNGASSFRWSVRQLPNESISLLAAFAAPPPTDRSHHRHRQSKIVRCLDHSTHR